MSRWRATGVHLEAAHRDGCQEALYLTHVRFTDVSALGGDNLNGPRGSALLVICADSDCPMRAVIHEQAIEQLLAANTKEDSR